MNAWRFALAAAWLVAAAAAATAQERSQGRSMVISQFGIVAAEHPIAARAGTAMLESGGNAIDAAVAANAAMGLPAPMMNGIGGDLFLIYWDAKTGKLYGLNASGWAPRGLSIDFLKKQGISSMPHEGIHSVTVPGAVDGWSKAHQRFGRIPWKDLFSDAIYYAEHGYPVPELIHEFWEEDEQVLKQTPEAQRIYLPGGKVPELGEMFSNPDLGKTLRLIAEGGRDAFYRGEIARRLDAFSKAHNGLLRYEDMAAFRLERGERGSVVGGRFDVRFTSPRWPFRMIAGLMNRRSRWSGISTGDQGIFVTRAAFDALGGYPDIPLMEDIELTRRLKRLGRLASLDLRGEVAQLAIGAAEIVVEKSLDRETQVQLIENYITQVGSTN
jgi:hypothetical protein